MTPYKDVSDAQYKGMAWLHTKAQKTRELDSSGELTFRVITPVYPHSGTLSDPCTVYIPRPSL